MYVTDFICTLTPPLAATWNKNQSVSVHEYA